MALVVDLLHRVGWPSHGNRAGSDNPCSDSQRPIDPDYVSPYLRDSDNQDAGLPDRRDEIQNSNSRLVDPASGKSVCKHPAKRLKAKAQKATEEEDEGQQRQRSAPPQIPFPLLPDECSEPNLELRPQRLSQRASLNLSSPKSGVLSAVARETVPSPSGQTLQTPSATNATGSSPLHNHEAPGGLSSSPPVEDTTRMIPFPFSVDNLWEDFEDIIQEMLARMGLLVPVDRWHQVALRDAVTCTSESNMRVRPERLPRIQVANSPCSICLDVPAELPHLPPTLRCMHLSTICATCLEKYISHAVQSQGLTILTCPNPECRQTMEYADVVRGARSEQACLDRYETLLLRRTLENEKNFVWCKNPTCSWGQIHESGDTAPIVVCQACHARSCFTHDVPWHIGLTCEQYTTQLEETQRRETEDWASQAYIDQHAKVCPNPSCGRRIEKWMGCDHMTCRRPGGCGHEFCWICLADYNLIRREGNHRHKSACRHYVAIKTRAPVPVTRPRRTPEELERLRQDYHRVRQARIDAERLTGSQPRAAPAPVRIPQLSLPASQPPPAAPRLRPIRLPATRPPAIPPPTRPPINAPLGAPPSTPPAKAPRTPSRSMWKRLFGKRNQTPHI